MASGTTGKEVGGLVLDLQHQDHWTSMWRGSQPCTAVPAESDCLPAESVNVASVPSVTRALDAWGKRIFTQIKSALHAEPSTLLPDYSR